MPDAGDSSSHLLTAVGDAKRQIVTAACQRCRKRKIKCNGERPCSRCQSAGTECIFPTQEGETRQQAVKRKYDELSESHQDVLAVQRILAGQDESQAVEAFHLIRTGEEPSAIIEQLQATRTQERAISPSLERRRQLRELVVVLALSTVSLAEMVNIANLVTNSRIDIVMPRNQDVLQVHREFVMTRTYITDMLANAGLVTASLPRSKSLYRTKERSEGSHNGPLFWVPASPWVTIIDNEFAVSHLVSIFLSTFNGYWRFLEEELFLRGMRSRDVTSTYCSAALVHAVLACAATYSKIDEAFYQPGNLLTRGEHFHNEAERLWALEDREPSIANVQTMAVLALAAGLRGKDRQSWSSISSAIMLNDGLQPLRNCRYIGITEKEYLRARVASASNVAWMQACYGLALQQDVKEPSPLLEDAELVNEIFPDDTIYWIGYPMLREPIPLHSNLLFRYRNALTKFTYELIRLRLDQRHANDQDSWNDAKDLAARLFTWQKDIPESLQYRPYKPLPFGVVELHMQRSCLLMNLYDSWIAGMSNSGQTNEHGRDDDITSREAVDELWTSLFQHTHETATILRDFREAHGLIMPPAFLLQQTSVATLILLKIFERFPPAQRPAKQTILGSRAPITDSTSAFEECFRCLLACGMQIMFTRGVLRMVYHTALELKIQLPDLVYQMFRTAGEAAWKPSDVHGLQSTYHNTALPARVDATREDNGMESLLRKFESSLI